MSRLLLDTSVYAAFMRGDSAAVRALREADEVFISATVLGEMLAGFLAGKHTEKNRAELGRFLASPRVNLLDVDEETAERYAVIFRALRATGIPIPSNDIWIAASAMQFGLRLLTLDSHFAKVPQIVTQIPV